MNGAQLLWNVCAKEGRKIDDRATCQLVNSQMRTDLTKLNNSTKFTVEAGFGVKGSYKMGSFDVHAGVSLHDEKSFSQTDGKVTSAGPITDKLEGDIGGSIGKAGVGFEKGFQHSGGDEAPIERYSETSGSMETSHGGEISGKSGDISVGVSGYSIIGGGGSLSFDSKALVDVVKDIPSAFGYAATQFFTQQ